LRSLDGFWIFSKEIEVDHPSRIQGFAPGPFRDELYLALLIPSSHLLASAY
jgi:hypothetical protein